MNELTALMNGAVQTSETLVNLYQSTRRYNPEDRHLHTHRRENIKNTYSAQFTYGFIYIPVISNKVGRLHCSSF
jgi:hypothetical protein